MIMSCGGNVVDRSVLRSCWPAITGKAGSLCPTAFPSLHSDMGSASGPLTRVSFEWYGFSRWLAVVFNTKRLGATYRNYCLYKFNEWDK